MTREEAIERLKQNKAAAEYFIGLYGEIYSMRENVKNEFKDIEALDMAIFALSANGDLISRADAIEAVCGDCTIENRESCKRDGYCYEVRNLMALPSADMRGGQE